MQVTALIRLLTTNTRLCNRPIPANPYKNFKVRKPFSKKLLIKHFIDAQFNFFFLILQFKHHKVQIFAFAILHFTFAFFNA